MKRRHAIGLIAVLSAVVSLAVLLGSTAGLRFTLDRLLPGSAEWSAEDLEGSLWSGARAKRITLEMDAGRLELDGVELPWTLAPLDRHLTTIGARVQRLGWRPSPGAGDPTGGVESDGLELPATLTVDDLRIARLEIENPESGPPTPAEALVVSGQWQGETIRQLRLQGRFRGEWSLKGQAETRSPFGHQLSGTLVSDDLGDEVDFSLAGSVESTRLAASGGGVTLDGLLKSLTREPAASLKIGIQRPAFDAELDAAVTLDAVRVTGPATVSGEALFIDLTATRPEQAQLPVEGTIGWPQRGLDSHIRGHVGLDGHLDLTSDVRFDGSRWHPGLQTWNGTVRLTGAPSAPRLEADGDGPILGRPARLSARVSVDQDRVIVEMFELGTASDAVSLEGDIALTGTPTIRGQVTVDVGQLSRWDERLDGTLKGLGALEIEIRDDGIWGPIRLTELSGQLQDRPVTGRLESLWSGGQPDSLNLALVNGSNELLIQADAIGRAPWRAQARIADLGEFWAGAGGRVSADLTGTAGWPVSGAIEVFDGQWQGVSIASLRVDLSESGEDWTGQLNADDVMVRDLDMGRLMVTARGQADRIELDVDNHASIGRATARLHASLDAPLVWHVAALDLALLEGPEWQLQAPVEVNFDAAPAPALEGIACLVSGAAQVCAEQSEGMRYRLTAGSMDLELIGPYLAWAAGRSLPMSGQLDGEARFVLKDDGVGELDTTLQLRRLEIDAMDDWPALAMERVDLRAAGDDRFDWQLEAANERASIKASGSLDHPGRQADPRLGADIDFDLPDLQQWVADRQDVAGALSGRIRLDGPLSLPRVSGHLEGRNLRLPLEAFGRPAEDGQFDLSVDEQGQARIDGRFRLDQGWVQVTGSGSLEDGGRPAGIIEFSAQDALLADRPDLYLRADADLKLSVDSRQIRMAGKVVLNQASIRFGPGGTAVQTSPDVVYLDQVEDASTALIDLPVYAEIEVTTRQPVKISGRQLTGEVTGRITVLDSPDRFTTAEGVLNLSGTYRAYGRNLDITEGRITYARTELDNPALALEASRRSSAGLVGVRVTGDARHPDVELFSEPPMEPSDIVANLVLGENLDSASLGDASAVAAALAGLQASGLDPGVADIRLDYDQRFGGAALRIGRFLSPKLYLDYTFGLLEQIDRFGLTYRLGSNWTVKTQVGEEVQTSLNYRIDSGRPRREPDP